MGWATKSRESARGQCPRAIRLGARGSIGGMVLAVAAARSAAGETAAPPVLGTNAAWHLDAALHGLNMTRADLGFDKDVAEPRAVLPRIRRMLSDPLDLPRMADEILEASSAGTAAARWELVAGLLEVTRPPCPAGGPPDGAGACPIAGLDPKLDAALSRFMAGAGQASAGVAAAFAAVTADERRYAAAAFLADVFNAEEQAPVRGELAALGAGTNAIDQVLREGRSVDPEPAAARALDIVSRVDLPRLLAAARALDDAVERLAVESAEAARWPAQPTNAATALGTVWIGSAGADRYDTPALLILEPGGDDVYGGGAGAMNGLGGPGISVVLDLAGDDRYAGSGLLGPGAALFGLAWIVDLAGNDSYRCAFTGLGAAAFGAAVLEDRAGADGYEAHAFAQGAGYAGAGVLEDRAGDDAYALGFDGQAFAGVQGVGWLVDRAGNDRYAAGGRLPDHERRADRYQSLAQGFAVGMRPFAGGGVAALVDLAGNDSYEADVYGQGVGYWYAAGFLLDRSGQDVYRVYQYGQGSGIHLSLGLLADLAGDDLYYGHILAQGSAHDYGVGVLLDAAGQDLYAAHDQSQGRGINNALGLLIDGGGDDSYLAADPLTCQGIGHDGGARECGCLSLLLDLAGRDVYSCGARDGARLERPDVGAVYDWGAGDGGAWVREEGRGAADAGGRKGAPGPAVQPTRAADTGFSAAGFDELLFHAQRYATTEEKRDSKKRAREELLARGAAGLDFLVQRLHVENLWIAILAEQQVKSVPADEGVPILLNALGSEHENTRRYAAHLLGLYDAPQQAGRLLALLGDDKAAGAAVRTLGKWKVKEAVPAILPFLRSDKERRRVVAANALREIGDARATPDLVEALGDPYFTVRRAAGRALASLGRPAERALLESLPRSDGVRRREIVRTLGLMTSRRAAGPLRRLLSSPDPGVRDDAAQALRRIEASRPACWHRQAGRGITQRRPQGGRGGGKRGSTKTGGCR